MGEFDSFWKDIPVDVQQRVLKNLKPFIFKIPKWIPAYHLMDFMSAQDILQKHYSDNKEILRIMDSYDRRWENHAEFLLTEPNPDYIALLPNEIFVAFNTACLIRRVIKQGKKRGLSILIGDEYTSDIDVGGKVRAGGKKGVEVKHGNKFERKELKKEYQERLNELHRQNRKLSYTQLSKKVGKEFYVTAKTIRNNTSSPIKKKKPSS